MSMFNASFRQTRKILPWWWISKKVEIQFCEVPMRFNEDSEQERWNMHDPLRCGIFECRTLVSHNSLSKSAQYLRSSYELVWRIDSADTWSNALEHGETVAKVSDELSQQIGTARSGLLSTSTQEEWSSSGKQIRSMQRVFVVSWRSRFRTRCPDQEGHATIGPVLQVKTICCLWSIRNRNTGAVNIRRRVQNMDYHVQRPKPLRGRVYHVMIQITLQKMGISESYMRRETARDIIKHRKDSCVSAKTTIPKFLTQSTKGSGMIFLPMAKSKGGRQNTESRQK